MFQDIMSGYDGNDASGKRVTQVNILYYVSMGKT